MPFVPHTSQDEQLMLDVIGVDKLEDLFDEIPGELRAGVLANTPKAITEKELLRLMSDRAKLDEVKLSFLGAGAYEHHIPSAIWDIVTRGEFMTAYTPYQAEASQGTLQLIYEFQSMITRLTAMEVANASVYDGASALAEAVLMSVRANRGSKSRRVLMAGNVHPKYRQACENIIRSQKIEIETLDWDDETGVINHQQLKAHEGEDYAALVIAYPSFFGGLEDAARLTDWAHAQNQLVIGVVNPTAMGLIQPPGEWGETGADIVVGEGQPLGIPIASGGPYLGFMCCRQAFVRQMPGRIIGKTVDTEGKTGFALTLQAREQHIRRAKATSNICTNQGLLVTAATIYMSLVGDEGLRSIASQCHNGMVKLIQGLVKIPGAGRRFSAPVFHEVVIQLAQPAKAVLAKMASDGILGGYDLGEVDPSLADCLLTNITETKNDADIEMFLSSLARALEVESC
ncbi:MAG: aminomethyl-transferring glycine dehydrogenase subunit GcvPA [bacterium]|nr:aminomethyl-transferring glycine dehydrogenase subunit GcvPA [Gammaproteobacteria bacterium]HIL94428.1 aminomethyl-transferring glycine dehydrogenase subunit GcvPA [Pseudomonadales bacterium]